MLKLDYEKMGSEYSRDTEVFRVIEVLIDENEKLREEIMFLAKQKTGYTVENFSKELSQILE